LALLADACSKGVGNVIHELRIYTLKPGTLPAYLKLNTEVGRVVRGDRYGKLVGAWTTEFGTLNQYVHLWEYDSVEERARLRGELAKYADWGAYTSQIRPFMNTQENMMLTLDEQVGFRPVAGRGHLYELRSYRGYPGDLATWARAFKEALPAREQYSKLVGLWQSDVGMLNTAVHLWSYDDLNQRAAVRAAAGADPVWSAYIPKASPLIAEQQSVILVPTPSSPLQ
jgi:hypothetical protein